MAWYKTGTITVTNGSTTVSGAGTAWISNAAIGEALYAPDGKLYEIANIASDTTMTIAPAYLGTTASAQPYVIVPSQSYIRDLAAQAADLVNNYSTIANNAGVGKFGDGTLGAPGIRFSDDLDTGFFRSASNEVTFVAGGTAIFKYNLTGGLQLSSVNLDGGTIDGTVIGATTRSTGAFTTLTANGATTFTANTASTTTTTGTAIITGGLGVSGRINAANFDGIVGANTAAAGSFTSITDSGNLTFTGTGNRITGDFSNATVANRVAVQTSTTNGNTAFLYLPNGTSQTANAQFHNASDPTNAANMLVGVTSSDATLRSGITGTGTYLPMTFYTGGSERVRIDTSGNVGIGTSSPSGKFDLTGSLGKFTIDLSGTSVSLTYGSANYLRASSAGGNLRVGGYDFVSFETGSGFSERMRIGSSGNVLIGQTTAPNGERLGVYASTGWTASITSNVATTGTSLILNSIASQQFAAYFQTSTNVTAGYIYCSGGTTSYVTTSDYRLKENVAPMTGALATVAQLKPCTYTWKADGSDGEGFIAHELQAVCPQAVTGEKDAVDEDGNPKYQGVDTSFLVATLTAAIQELKAEFDAYKLSHP